MNTKEFGSPRGQKVAMFSTLILTVVSLAAYIVW